MLHLDKHYDTTVGIHFSRYPETNPNIFGNPGLVRHLGELGAASVLIPNIGAYHPIEATVDAKQLIYSPNAFEGNLSVGEGVTGQLGTGGVEAVRARVALNRDIEDLVPVVNDLALRRIGNSKWEQYRICSDVMPVTVLLEADKPLTEDLISRVPGDKVVIKRVAGGESKWVTVSSKNDIAEAVSVMRTRIADEKSKKKNFKDDIVLQEFVPGERIKGLRPINEVELRKYHELGKDGHELRFFCFVSSDDQAAMERSVVLRAFDEGAEDEWIFIDQDGVPAAPAMLAEAIAHRTLQAAGSLGGVVAVDLFKGKLTDNSESSWLVREVNVKDPQLILPADSLEVSNKQRAMLARLLVRTAGTRKA